MVSEYLQLIYYEGHFMTFLPELIQFLKRNNNVLPQFIANQIVHFRLLRAFKPLIIRPFMN